MKWEQKAISVPWFRLWQPRDTHPAHRAGEHQRSLGCALLIVAFGFLLLCLFFGISLLRLNLLMPTCHFRTEEEGVKSRGGYNLNLLTYIYKLTGKGCIILYDDLLVCSVSLKFEPN